MAIIKKRKKKKKGRRRKTLSRENFNGINAWRHWNNLYIKFDLNIGSLAKRKINK